VGRWGGEAQEATAARRGGASESMDEPGKYQAMPDTTPNPGVVYMSGYLHKRRAAGGGTSSGTWQRRYFETNGSFLTYYKSSRMSKLLAALSLPQVGAITLLPEDAPVEDNDGALFSIELNDRLYMLRASSRAEAQRWVEVLNALKDGGGGGQPTGDAAATSEQTQGAAGTSSDAKETWKKEPRGCLALCCIPPRAS